MKRLLVVYFLLLSSLYCAPSTIVTLELRGAIGPASSKYIQDGMLFAKVQNADFVLIELDTPGGLATSMREMIQEITNSSIPVVTYVSPKGSRAASAGTYILYASHIAAMAPGTNLGAATPVSMMPLAPNMDVNTSKKSALEKKVINDAMAYIKSLAQLNDRNISWALDAVKEGKSLSARDALSNGVIDIVADDMGELLSKLNGRSVALSSGNIVLKTDDTAIINYEADFKTRILSIITDPNIAYILLVFALYGILFELMNPGAIIPGVIGVISGLIALYALNVIPFSYTGVLLMLLGVSFMLAEVLVAGFGVLGIGGVFAFAFGSFLLFDADTLGKTVSIPLIVALTLVSLAFFILIMKLFLSSRNTKIVTGSEEMIGMTGEVIECKEGSYLIHCHGETWNATSKSSLKVGQKVQVIELCGLVLDVEPIKE